MRRNWKIKLRSRRKGWKGRRWSGRPRRIEIEECADEVDFHANRISKSY